MYDLSRDGVTQSLLCMFMTCRQRALHYLNGYKPKASKEALAFGTLFHWLLEHHYKSFFDLVYNGGTFASPQVMDYPTSGQQYEGANSEKWEQVQFLADALYDAYREYYWNDDYSIDWIGQEVEFSVPFDVPACDGMEAFTVLLRGKRDGLFHAKRGMWMMENKTTSQFDEEAKSRQLEIDFQNLFYITATELEQSCNISGVLYNVIRRPGNRQKQTESLYEFRNRVRDVIAEDPGSYFKRFEVKYTKQTKKQFREDLCALLREFKMWQEGSLATYKNTSACTGMWSCDYLPACASNSMVGYTTRARVFEELGDARKES